VTQDKKTSPSRARAAATAVEALIRMPRLFQSLCDPTRVQILCDLLQSRSPRTVSSIAAGCPVDLSVVSRHLRALLDVGILAREKHGKEAHYRVDARALSGALRSLADAIDACCGDGGGDASRGTRDGA
jgi:DNA-binding transcriptional ArsR family regulator